jgi:predicted DNA-binding transcriptional regulator YafY
MRHVRNLPEKTPANPQLFYSIEVLDEAIENHKQVQFALNEIDYNKQRKVRTDSEGAVRYFTFNPYQMVATNGRYYLIGNFDVYDNLAYVRLDHISDILLLETKAKPIKKVAGMENGLNLPQHMAEHVYMLYGDTVRVHFKAPKYLADQIVDWFGYSFTVLSEDQENMIVQVDVNERAMRFWALQYGTFVEVLEPKSLRDDIMKSVRKMMDNYNVSEESGR